MLRKLVLIGVAALGLSLSLAACENASQTPLAGTASVQPDAAKGSCTTPPGGANTGC